MNASNKRKDGIDMRVAIIGISALLGFCWCAATESTYKRDATITSINHGLVCATDSRGNDWEFWGDDFYIGQEVTLVMDDNHTTSNIYDDFVKKVLTR